MPPKPPAVPKIIGHRGAAAHAPENTLAGFRKARDLGCAMVEFDVKLSRDGVPVLMHDDHVARTAGGAPGAVRELGMDELAALDVGGWFHFDYVGERVPTLEEALFLALDLGLAVNIEIKPCGGREAETATAAIAVARRVWPADREPPLISSFSREALIAAKAAAPDWPRGWLVDERPDHWREIVAEVDPATIHVNHANQTRESVADYKAGGHPVLVYTVNDPDRAAELLALGVDAVITDRPDALFALVRD
ncbi:MAG: glycerophosphodiester phosphodiesterase [Deinococcus-Thermus bacterium]|jgi:glycerophosphoryl diester phosphodiesterase|nr:glycerophosphodiester phosphodiesterase [Deinococcota bacterium]